MPKHKIARSAYQRQSLASGAAFGEYVTKQRDVAPLLATKPGRKTMMTAIKLGLAAFYFIRRGLCRRDQGDSCSGVIRQHGSQVYKYAP
jgi:hypothetical protein